MKGDEKMTGYEFWVMLARKMAENEEKPLLPHQEQALWYNGDISDVFWEQVNSLESALKFLSDFYWFHNQRLNIKTMKVKAWRDDDVYNSFFAKLNIASKDSKQKKRALNTVVTVGELIYKATKKEQIKAMKKKEQGDVNPYQIFYSAFDEINYMDKSKNNSQVHEFFNQIKGKFLDIKSKGELSEKVA